MELNRNESVDFGRIFRVISVLSDKQGHDEISDLVLLLQVFLEKRAFLAGKSAFENVSAPQILEFQFIVEHKCKK